MTSAELGTVRFLRDAVLDAERIVDAARRDRERCLERLQEATARRDDLARQLARLVESAT